MKPIMATGYLTCHSPFVSDPERLASTVSAVDEVANIAKGTDVKVRVFRQGPGSYRV